MADALLEDRVTYLEELMSELIRTVNRAQQNVDQLSSEMRVFKNEMRLFRDDMQRNVSRTNKQWGELANKMGTMAEDLVAPSIPRILREVVKCTEKELPFLTMRYRRAHPEDPGRVREFDVVAACGDYLLINETKSQLRAQDIDQFVATMSEAREFFPEHSERRFIGAIASLNISKEVALYGERQGLLVLGYGAGAMDVLNTPEFMPHAF